MVIACISQISYKQYTLSLQHDKIYAEFFMQQQDLLTRISRLVAGSVKNRDHAGIQSILSAYEGVMFSMQLPIGLQIAFFDAPQEVVGLNAQLTPDEVYYTNILQWPLSLALSEQYALPVMPDYYMLSYGLGIVDVEGNVLGILEAKVPGTLLQEYLDNRYAENIVAYSVQLISLYFVVTVAILAIIWRMQAMQDTYRQDIRRMQKYIQIQDKYQNMHGYKTNVNIIQVMLDVYEVCKLQAHNLGVNIEFVSQTRAPIYCYCQQIELYRNLYSIMQNILAQLGVKANLKIAVEIAREQIIFKFMDDGYYYDLGKEWGDCVHLVTHKHTTYQGNVICYVLKREIKNNVVFMEQVLETT